MRREGPRDTGLAPASVLAEYYSVERLLGRGGMATVYLCTDTRTGDRVAVKILREELGSAVTVERFLREIDFASELDYPQIPKVLDSGMIGDLPFYVMTYIDGESLGARLKREKQLPIADAIRIARAASEAMTFAHRRGIVHRDIKPENILLSGDKVYVLDFGVARAIVESAGERITSTGIAVGTPAYMSPEQALGERDLDSRSDVYSLGCVLYEMIAGIPPFVGPTAQVVMSRRFVAPAPPLREMRESVSEAIEQTVAKALAKSPADRWQSAAEFSVALSNPVEQSAARWIADSWRRRRRLTVWVTAGVALVATAAAVTLSRRSSEAMLNPANVAVLYFDDHTADASLEYLARGLTVSLIKELSGVSAIKVISSNGVKEFRGRPDDNERIAAALNVGSIVEGSVQKSGDRIRVTAQLIDARTGRYVEAATIESAMGELFSLEDTLARRVAVMLRRQIGRQVRIGEAAAATSSAIARDLVFRADKAREDADSVATVGEPEARVRGLVLLENAEAWYSEAERADPSWVEPIVGRGWVALETALRTNKTQRIGSFDDAIQHASRAMSRDPRNANALELSGSTHYYRAARLGLGTEKDLVLKRAATDLQNAVRLDTTLATGWAMLSRAQVALGQFGNAGVSASTAFRMDAYLKKTAEIVFTQYLAALMLDSLELAWRYCGEGARAYSRNPRFVLCRLTLLAEDRKRQPDPESAWKLVELGKRLDPGAGDRDFIPIHRAMLAAVVTARAGDKDSAKSVATWAAAAVSGNHELTLDFTYDEAYLSLVLGDTDGSLDRLDRYLKARSELGCVVLKHPRWRELREHPQFVRITSAAMQRSAPASPGPGNSPTEAGAC